MTKPTVCVVIPAHPARLADGKLTRAVQSVCAQEGATADQISVTIDTERAGAAATRARALAAARTDWVAFLDSDDLFLPMHLRRMLAHAEKTGADFVYSWFKILQQWPDGRTNILEDDPIFPMSHYTDDFDPASPIETTMTVFVRREIAQNVGMRALDRGEANSGEDRAFTLDCLAAGAKISHLKSKTWLWCHAYDGDGGLFNTGGLPTRGDAKLLR
jgi:glycosyltransferase involved in cell wall biosynthesis